jgi:hypothetical protein
MIAVVLLIAFTVAVGSIISLFLTGLTVTTTGETVTETEKITLCAPSVLRMDEVYYSSPSAAMKITLHYISGTKDLEVVNFTLIDTDRNSATTTGVTGTLTPGETEIFDIPANAELTGADLQEVTVLAFCLKTYPIRASCIKDQPCMVKV